jgi:hypothetical protein
MLRRDPKENPVSCKTAWAALVLCALGCTENPVIEEANRIPVANAGPDQVVPFQGAAVDVVLDASASTDADGVIIEYRWLSATRPPGGGPGRYWPPGETMDWPADGVTTAVRLPQGVWMFSLQVTDDAHATGEQDTVTITVGSAPVAGSGGGGMGGGGAGGGAPIGGIGGGGAGGDSGGTGGGAGGTSGTSGAGGTGGSSGAG